MNRTNSTPYMRRPFPPPGSRALSTLHAGGLVLLPTANLWQLAAHAGNPAAVRRALTCCPPAALNRPELVFADAAALRAWFPLIHPRLDILLDYHRRPLTMLVPASPRVPLPLIDGRGEVAVRLAQDSYVYRLCEDLEGPLLCTLALPAGARELPTRFGQVRSDVLRCADHIVQRRQREVLGDKTTVVIRYNEQTGEVEFP